MQNGRLKIGGGFLWSLRLRRNVRKGVHVESEALK